MRDTYAQTPFHTCLRQPVYPPGHGSSTTVPTGTPAEGCPIGCYDEVLRCRRPFEKTQRQFPFQVIRNIAGRYAAYFEQWGSLDVGDPARFGVYKLMIPDPLGDGTFRDRGQGEDLVAGWNGSVLVNSYPYLNQAVQGVARHSAGQVPQWDEGTVDRGIAVDAGGRIHWAADTFEGFHWLKRGYAVLYVVSPRSYLTFYTEPLEQAVRAGVELLDELFPFAGVPSNRGKHRRRFRFFTASSVGSALLPAIAERLPERASGKPLFDGAYSTGFFDLFSLFSLIDAHWILKGAVQMAAADIAPQVLGWRPHEFGRGELEMMELAASWTESLERIFAAVGNGRSPYGNSGIRYGSELAASGELSEETVELLNQSITTAMGGRRCEADCEQLQLFSEHYRSRGSVEIPCIVVNGLAEGMHSGMFARLWADKADAAAQKFDNPVYRDNLIGLNFLEPMNRKESGGFWSPVGTVGLINLAVDLLECLALTGGTAAEFMAREFQVAPDRRNRYFFEGTFLHEIDNHILSPRGEKREGDYRRELVPLAAIDGESSKVPPRTRNAGGCEFSGVLRYDALLRSYIGVDRNGCRISWHDCRFPREIAGMPPEDL